jgi:signal transduction histidine kinase
MKKKFLVILFLPFVSIVSAQQNEEDSLRDIISQHKADTAEVKALVFLSNQKVEFDSSFKYAQQGLLLARRLNYWEGEAMCLLVLCRLMGAQTNFSQAIQYGLNALDIFKKLNDKTGIASAHLLLQATYREAGDFKSALIHSFAGEQFAEANNVTGETISPGHRLAPLFLAETGQTYILKNQLDSAEIYTQRSITQNELFNGAKWNFPIYLLATIQTRQGKYSAALANFRSAIPLAIQNGFFGDTLQIFSGMSTLFSKMGELDSSIYYAKSVSGSWNGQTEIKNLLEALNTLATCYQLNGEKDSALKFIMLSHSLKDSIFSREKDKELQNIAFNEKLKEQEITAAQLSYKNRVRIVALAGLLFVVFLVSGLLLRHNYHRKKAYRMLEEQKKDIDYQKTKAEQALEELESTQSQLIQREKMASLGELTAGIAHEIQNPLNFVNNFADINTELIGEAGQEIDKGNISEAKIILHSIKENEKKINHHGKRADAIVKGMLQHSRHANGIKEPSDINKLADEYLRLAYHGFRAKVKSFNVTMETDFDETIGKINIIPQDIGRVILNLINNALYVVDEKKKQLGDNYEPAVSIGTKKVGDKVLIAVKDNGNGILPKVVDKIFQPFYTTKPTGQGTGLGLSLAYDIVKAHGGEIKVMSKEGEGSEFDIVLPII